MTHHDTKHKVPKKLKHLSQKGNIHGKYSTSTNQYESTDTTETKSSTTSDDDDDIHYQRNEFSDKAPPTKNEVVLYKGNRAKKSQIITAAKAMDGVDSSKFPIGLIVTNEFGEIKHNLTILLGKGTKNTALERIKREVDLKLARRSIDNGYELKWMDGVTNQDFETQDDVEAFIHHVTRDETKKPYLLAQIVKEKEKNTTNSLFQFFT